LILFMTNPEDGSSSVDAYVDALRAAQTEGFIDIWTPQIVRTPDVLTTLAYALSRVEEVVVGTGVIPIQPRHPMVLAQQALTVSSISGGRLRLGIGLTHPSTSETVYGIPWQRNVRRLNEYLDGLLPLLAGEEANATGELMTTRGAIQMSGVPAPAVYVAALGPQILKVAARRTAGTLTYMVGPKTLAEHTIPAVRSAASGRSQPAEVVAGFPMCVTDEPEAVRAFAAEALAVYGTQPSYRAMLDREGVNGPADVALIGDETAIMAKLEDLSAMGVDEVAVNVLGRNAQDVARTRALLRTAAAKLEVDLMTKNATRAAAL
jgi:5,10-methylenetetrahydromethanopterin reductase